MAHFSWHKITLLCYLILTRISSKRSSSWDIFYDLLLPYSFLTRTGITFLICNSLLLAAYCYQEKLQHIHNSISQPQSYYGKAFALRFVYTYLLTIAYVLQWKCYWESYNEATKQVNYIYFVVISLLTLLIYRLVLQRSLVAFTKTVPFFLSKDEEFSAYFLQAKVLRLEEHYGIHVENVLNFFYFEFVEMLLSVYTWKGTSYYSFLIV